MPITSPAASALSDATFRPRLSPAERKQRRDGQRREESVDHGRDACQHFQHWLRDRAKSAARVFGKVDGRKQADRHGDRHRDERNQECPGKQRHRAEGTGRADLVGADRELRTPLRAEDELGQRDQPEELQRLIEHRQDDADGRQDRDQRAAEQCHTDDLLDPVACPHPGLDAKERDPAAGERHAKREHREARAAERVELLPEPRGAGDFGRDGIRRHIARYDITDVIQDQGQLARRQPLNFLRDRQHHFAGDDAIVQRLPAQYHQERRQAAPDRRQQAIVGGKRVKPARAMAAARNAERTRGGRIDRRLPSTARAPGSRSRSACASPRTGIGKRHPAQWTAIRTFYARIVTELLQPRACCDRGAPV